MQHPFHRLLNVIRRTIGVKRNENRVGPHTAEETSLTGDLARDAETIRHFFHNSFDLKIRSLIDRNEDSPVNVVIYIDGLVSTDRIAEHIVAPLQTNLEGGGPSLPESSLLPPNVVTVGSIERIGSELTLGRCLVLHRGLPRALAVDVSESAHRNIEQPQSEPTERGPREAFIEDIKTNIALVRRRMRTNHLKVERLVIGRESRTNIVVTYLTTIARPDVVDEMLRRLQSIQTDAILDAVYLEEYISDNPLPVFSTVLTTERPDRVVAMMLEGSVAVFIDGSPIALLAPATFVSHLQSPDDYYKGYLAASLVREVRWIAALIGLVAVPVYVAILSYHNELIPTALIFTVVSGRERIPFPPIIEALMTLFAFEVLREAGLRLPRQIGPALSIVGVLVLGDASVRAGILSPLMIVVVGMTAISTFAIPSASLSNSIRLLRVPLTILAGFIGLFGVYLGIMLIVGMIVNLRSFGVPYFTPFAPVWLKEWKDSMIRAPAWMHTNRPWHSVQDDAFVRQPSGQKAKPGRRQK